MYRTVLSIVGHDVLELFGDTGTGKTTFAFALAIGALQEGKKVIYIDTERNIDEHLINRLKVLGLEYHYFTSISDVLNFLNNRPKADVYILDSIGMPALRHKNEKPHKAASRYWREFQSEWWWKEAEA